LDTYNLRDAAIREQYITQLHSELARNENGTPDLQDVFRKTGEDVLGFKTRHRKQWLSDSTWALIEQREIIKIKLLSDHQDTENLENVHKQVCRQIKKSARMDKRRYYSNIARDAQRAAIQNDTRCLYNKIKTISTKGAQKQHPVKDKRGNLLTNTDEQLNRWC
jgi:hypothetical protein